jgi:hypothetical protein
MLGQLLRRMPAEEVGVATFAFVVPDIALPLIELVPRHVADTRVRGPRGRNGPRAKLQLRVGCARARSGELLAIAVRGRSNGGSNE